MHHHRRRKKRPNYGSVEVSRGEHGFGFTISGQQPCILSCIVPNSPAEIAGLRSGDFLISVNGMNVSKLPHESVVQIIGSSLGTIRLAIAENYYSDSSDDEGLISSHIQQRVRPKYPHHKLKINRNIHNRLSLDGKKINGQENEPLPSTSSAATQNAVLSSESSNKGTNVVANKLSPRGDFNFNIEVCRTQRSLEYRTIVGYLGTIEMPKQIATSSKLQTVRSCIRKIRQEKRNPTIVLMTILPHCLTLKNNLNVMLAKYPNSRLSFVSGNTDNDKRFFGLVTSAMYSDGLMCEDGQHQDTNIIISNSCHVFVVDTKLIEHSSHVQKADEFQITCTKDPISDLCLEFPNNSEYVVNLIRSMYTLKSVHPNENEGSNIARQLNMNESPRRCYPRSGFEEAPGLIANSPQPSNNSEITTTSSNSDSGIGFHNDCANISDRILVVDFSGLQHRQIANIRGNLRQPLSPNSRPIAIINDHSLHPVRNIRSQVNNTDSCQAPMVPLHTKSKSMDLIADHFSSRFIDSRQGVRPIFTCNGAGGSKDSNYSPIQLHQNQDYDDLVKTSPSKSLHESVHVFQERPIDVSHKLQSGHRSKVHNIRSSHLAARSCDDVMIYRASDVRKKNDVILFDATSGAQVKCNDDYVFLPPKPIKKLKKPSSYKYSKSSTSNINKCSSKSIPVSSKLLVLSRPASASVENLLPNDQLCEKSDYESLWGSMQDLRRATMQSNSGNLILEGTYSEPDLTSRALPSNSSPFKKWGQSSFRSRSNEARAPVQRRPSSLAASESDVYTKSIDDDIDSLRSRSDLTSSTTNTSSGVTSWGTSFEKLLDDPAGLHTFAEFLKKEFSGENIYFWTSCERYRHMDDVERSKEAIQIFSKHLGVGAPEPVNVDSQARTTAQDNLERAESDLFMQAQKQIFNLMKFDSYQRFIRSDLYKSCLDAEAKKLPLPYPGDQLDFGLRTHLVCPLASKLKKSLSNAEDRRRKSLLPWHRKARCKSKDRGEDIREKTQTVGVSGANTLKVTHSGSDLHSSRSSLSSFDAAISCRTNNQNDCDENKSSLCRVILSDGATTIVQTRPNESIRELVERLLEKRGICYQAYEGFLAGNNKPLDLDGPSVSLAGKEMLIEQRVVFKLDLPNRKVISVKSKPCKALGEVLRPILHKYSYRLDLVQVLAKDCVESINMTLPVTACDGQRLQIACKTGDYPVEIQQITTSQSPMVHKKTISQSAISPSLTHHNIVPPLTSTFHHSNHHISKNYKPNPQQSTLDEITNKVFNELLQEKVESHSQHNNLSNLREVSDQGSARSDDFGSETSSGIFGRLKRRDSNFPVGRLNKAKKIVTPSSMAESDDAINDGVKKPLIAKWKAGVKLQVTGRSDNHDFLEGLKRAQRFRLEDQRGTEINCELPDFLKDKENFTNNKLRKTKPTEPVPMARSNIEPSTAPLVRPQPAPRYSITKSSSSTSIQNAENLTSPTQKRLSPTVEITLLSNELNSSSYLNASFTSQISQSGSTNDEFYYDSNVDSNYPRGPPPLPPKPKILPIKPSNWGQSTSKGTDRSPQDEMITALVKPRNIFMDQANSSFV